MQTPPKGNTVQSLTTSHKCETSQCVKMCKQKKTVHNNAILAQTTI